MKWTRLIPIALALAAGIAFAANYATHRLTARGVSTPTATWAPPSSTWSAEVGQSQEQTIVLKNSGGGTLTGTVALAAGCPPVFTIVSGGGPYSLAHNATRSIVVRFAPTDTLLYQCDLRCNP
jgi:hypothetical protein